MDLFEILKAVLFGIVEGITEWLPVSSTGHLIILNELVPLKVSPEFYEMFQVVIQLGAIMAVVLLYFNKLNPFSFTKTADERKGTWSLWFKVVAAVLPSAVIGLLFDDWFDAHFYNYQTVAIMLIVYGITFLFVEGREKKKLRINDVDSLDYKTAIMIGAFQVLAIIPGTSRSGATILGAMLIGTSRVAAAEFSFFLAIPTMAGASLLKVVKFILEGAVMDMSSLAILITGCVVSFIVSIAAIKALMSYVKNRSFAVFGVYRIILGIAVLAFFLI